MTRARDRAPPRSATDVHGILYWIYAGRLTVTLAVYGAAVLVGGDWIVVPARLGAVGVGRLALVTLLAVVAATAASYWVSHRRGVTPTASFLYAQAALDVSLVTGVVLLTGGSESVFPPLLYIALVSGYALITPLSAGLAIAAGTGAAYLVAIAFAYGDQWGAGILLQAAIFTIVACVSGLIGGRLRLADRRLSNLESELNRLRVGTADILRTINAAVLTVDAEGRAVYLNPAAASLFRLEPAACIGKPVLDRLGERAPGIQDSLREALTAQPVRAREVEIEDPEGSPIPFSVSTALLEREGAPALATVVLQDLRMARQVEELHLRAERFAVVAELSASLAHEIKNPLASIRSAVEQIADPESEDGDRKALSALVVREADRLARLLSEFNDFARVDVARRERVDLERVLRESVEVVAQRPEARERASFEIEVAAGLDDLWGDSDLIHRTLTNLVLNAVQVSGPGRPVTVRVIADALRPGAMPPGLASGMPVRIRVIDDGPGIRPEDVGRVFDPFYTRRQGGSGMGLAIAHRAVQAHGGVLLVSSTLGRGATFAVILPRREPELRKAFADAGGVEKARPPEPGDSPITSQPRREAAEALDGFADRLG